MREYLLSNNESYKRAIKNTGPINAAEIYKIKEQERESIDIPVSEWWKYSNKYERYKIPSFFAKDHKKYKGLEDIIDSEKLNKIPHVFINSIQV